MHITGYPWSRNVCPSYVKKHVWSPICPEIISCCTLHKSRIKDTNIEFSQWTKYLACFIILNPHVDPTKELESIHFGDEEIMAERFRRIFQGYTTGHHANPAEFTTKEDDVMTLRLWRGKKSSCSLQCKSMCLERSVLVAFIQKGLLRMCILLLGILVLPLIYFQGVIPIRRGLITGSCSQESWHHLDVLGW